MPGDMPTQKPTKPLRNRGPAMLQDVLCSFALARPIHLSQERRNRNWQTIPTLLFINGSIDYSCCFYCSDTQRHRSFKIMLNLKRSGLTSSNPTEISIKVAGDLNGTCTGLLAFLNPQLAENQCDLGSLSQLPKVMDMWNIFRLGASVESGVNL